MQNYITRLQNFQIYFRGLLEINVHLQKKQMKT